MTKDIERINNLFINWSEDKDGYLGVLYNIVYPESIPETYIIVINDKNELVHYNFESKPVLKRVHSTKDFNLSKTLSSFKNDHLVYCYPISMYEYYVFGQSSYCKFIISICVDGEDTGSSHINIVTNDIDEFMRLFSKHLIIKEKENTAAEFGIATMGDDMLYTSWYDLPKSFNCDIKKNYCDDLPYDKICNILEDDSKADLLLFYGEPGTGKTSLIKHFINLYKDTNFIFLDASVLQCIQPATFVSYLITNQNCVLILEDCEKILTSRDISPNGVMSTLLNITDGVISDILGIKLICTFNTSLNGIDKALLRKGRLSLKYEFKKLPLNKCKQINPNATKDSVLADLYNEEENDYSKKPANRIGF